MKLNTWHRQEGSQVLLPKAGQRAKNMITLKEWGNILAAHLTLITSGNSVKSKHVSKRGAFFQFYPSLRPTADSSGAVFRQTQWHRTKHKKRHFQVKCSKCSKCNVSVPPSVPGRASNVRWNGSDAKIWLENKEDGRMLEEGSTSPGLGSSVNQNECFQNPVWWIVFFFFPLNSFTSNVTASGAGTVHSTSYHGDVPGNLRSTENPGLTMKVPW